MARYVNIYRDAEGRYISDEDYPTRALAEFAPRLDRALVIETVRILSKEEERDVVGGLVYLGTQITK